MSLPRSRPRSRWPARPRVGRRRRPARSGGISMRKSPWGPPGPSQSPRWSSSPGGVWIDRRSSPPRGRPRRGSGPSWVMARELRDRRRVLPTARSRPGSGPGGRRAATGRGLIPGWVEGRLPGLVRAPRLPPAPVPAGSRRRTRGIGREPGRAAPPGNPSRLDSGPWTSPGNPPTVSAGGRRTDASPRRGGRPRWPRRGRPGRGRRPGDPAVPRRAEEDVLWRRRRRSGCPP